MFIKTFLISLLLFFIGLFGIIFYKRNYLLILLFIELMLLSVNYNLIIFSIILNDISGQILAIYVLIIAGAESSIGLAILLLYYRITGSINDISIVNLRKIKS